jgi:hypothetical protein
MTAEELEELKRIFNRESNEFSIKCAKHDISPQEEKNGHKKLTEMKQYIEMAEDRIKNQLS